MNDFIKEGVKVGDRLWSANYGWGEVESIYEGVEHPLELFFDSGVIDFFNKNGLTKEDYGQTLFLDKKSEIIKEVSVFINFYPKGPYVHISACDKKERCDDVFNPKAPGARQVKGKLIFTILIFTIQTHTIIQASIHATT